jgi:hypothetical protein
MGSINLSTARDRRNSIMIISKQEQDSLHTLYVPLIHHHMERQVRVIVIKLMKMVITKLDICICNTYHEY